jgi:hypothetical protein
MNDGMIFAILILAFILFDRLFFLIHDAAIRSDLAFILHIRPYLVDYYPIFNIFLK